MKRDEKNELRRETRELDGVWNAAYGTAFAIRMGDFLGSRDAARVYAYAVEVANHAWAHRAAELRKERAQTRAIVKDIHKATRRARRYEGKRKARGDR